MGKLKNSNKLNSLSRMSQPDPNYAENVNQSGREQIMHGFKQGVERSEQITFYIKTIQFYDAKAKPINEPILVEQVFGKFDDFRLYDTSTLHYQNYNERAKCDKIFYFKRLFKEDLDY